MRSSEFRDNYSRGCQSCQQGKWLCIFLTYLCDAKCYFCPSPFKQQDKIVSAFGDDPSVILKHIKNSSFNGISFSGGDCFTVFERMTEWLSYFHEHLPDTYFWTYTNGLRANDKNLRELADCGLNEIRFNITATNYNSPQIFKTVKAATSIFENVAIEIPSIPSDYQKLIDVLPYFDSIRVKYLNLHEYILTPDNPYKNLSLTNTFTLNKVSEVTFDPLSSQNTERIKDFCQKNGLKIRINDCSLQKKENQLLQRRLMMGEIFKNSYEELSDEGLLETHFIYPKEISTNDLKELFRSEGYDQLRQFFIHPKEVKDNTAINSTTAKLSFLPPMSINDKRILLDIKLLTNEHNLV